MLASVVAPSCPTRPRAFPTLVVCLSMPRGSHGEGLHCAANVRATEQIGWSPAREEVVGSVTRCGPSACSTFPPARPRPWPRRRCGRDGDARGTGRAGACR